MIKIGKKQYDMYCSIRAISEIENLCGDLENLGEWMDSAKTTVGKLTRFAEIIAILVNAGIEYKAYTDGCSDEKIDSSAVTACMRPADVMSQKSAIFECIADSSKFDPGIDTDDEDIDLAEIESEKNASSAGA